MEQIKTSKNRARCNQTKKTECTYKDEQEFHSIFDDRLKKLVDKMEKQSKKTSLIKEPKQITYTDIDKEARGNYQELYQIRKGRRPLDECN